jgi:hypothetical protein
LDIIITIVTEHHGGSFIFVRTRHVIASAGLIVPGRDLAGLAAEPTPEGLTGHGHIQKTPCTVCVKIFDRRAITDLYDLGGHAADRF